MRLQCGYHTVLTASSFIIHSIWMHLVQTGELWLTIIHGGSMWFLLSEAIDGFSEKILAPVGCRAEPGSLATLARSRGSSFVPAAAPSGPVHRTSSFWFGSQVTGGLDLDQNFRDFPGCVVTGSRGASGLEVCVWVCDRSHRSAAVSVGTGCTSGVRSSFLRRLRRTFRNFAGSVNSMFHFLRADFGVRLHFAHLTLLVPRRFADW